MQRQKFEEYFGTSRYIYNRCVDAARLDPSCSSHIALRQRVLLNNAQLDARSAWQARTPYDTRQLVIKEFAAALAAARSNRRAGNIRHYRMEYRSRRDASQTFHVDHRAVSGMRLFPRQLQDKLRATSRRGTRAMQRYFEQGARDFRVQREYGRYYLLLPAVLKPLSTCARMGVVALDPGVRTFQTFYSPSGIAGEINPTPRLAHHQHRLTRVEAVPRRRRGQRRLRHRLIAKIRDTVSDLHWQAAHYLCRSFATVMIPPFETQRMSQRENRRLHRSTVKQMQTLSHFTFRQRLMHVATRYHTCVLVVNEAYTSKTCGACGRINAKLGSSKWFSCPCGVECDRDLHAARNILLRTIRNTDF